MKVQSLTLLLIALFASLPQCSASATDSPGQLSINLKTDKAQYHPREVINFSETFKNCGNDTISLYDDTCYYGDDVRIKRVSDGKASWDTTSSATHTVEAEFRPSKSIALKPGQEYKRTFSAYLTDDFQVAFQRHDCAGGSSGFSPGRTGGLNLPEKFVGCGRIYKLGQAGSYLVGVEYNNTHQWFNGDDISGKPKQSFWKGQTKSNDVTLKLK